jgi:hypothetical protein
VNGSLLVPDEDVLHLLLVKERIVDRKNRAARIAEDMLDPLILQGTDHHFGSGHRLAHVTRSVGSVSRVLEEFQAIKKAPEGACAPSPDLRVNPAPSMALVLRE